MSHLPELTRRLRNGFDLPEEACAAAAMALTEAAVPAAEKLDFLEALHDKGETADEVAAFARVFRGLALDPQLGDVAVAALDVVGTGGTGTRGFNISSVAALILAAAGVTVLKHGNRAITSQSGSADFLSQLGIRMDTDPARLRRAAEELHFCFFFAPAFHPAFKEIAPVRKELAARGKRSIFNILGPLINPARPAHQLLGVMSPKWVAPLAEALTRLGLRRGLAVCCELAAGGFMDELTSAHGRNHVAPVGGMAADGFGWQALDWGFTPCGAEELRGGTAAENSALLEDILNGAGRPGLVDTLVMNAAAGLLIVDKVDTPAEGCALAREVLLGGALRAWLDRARAFYAETSPAE